MANDLTYNLEVLANSSAEINQIAERLKQPSTELVNWVAEKYGESVNEMPSSIGEGQGDPRAAGCLSCKGDRR